MSHTSTGLVSYGVSGQPGANAPPSSSSLDAIKRRIDRINSNIHDLHGIADRACGQTNIQRDEAKTAPAAVPNGMLDEIEQALDGLVSLSDGAVARLSRIA